MEANHGSHPPHEGPEAETGTSHDADRGRGKGCGLDCKIKTRNGTSRHWEGRIGERKEVKEGTTKKTKNERRKK